MPRYTYIAPPPSDVLSISEIVVPICSMLDKGDNYNLARTCSSLAYTAVDELWRMQDTLSNLFDLLPRDALSWSSQSYHGEELEITRIIQPLEWNRFSVYNHRLRILRCATLPQMSALSVQHLLHFRDDPLIPNLKTLSITRPLQTMEEVMLAQLLIGPRLGYLRIHFSYLGLEDGARADVDLAAATLCRSLREKAPSLQHLHLRLPSHPAIQDELARTIDAMPTLQCIKIHGSCESLTVLNAISRLPNLRRLYLPEWKLERLHPAPGADPVLSIPSSASTSLEVIVAEDTIAWATISDIAIGSRPRIRTWTPRSHLAYPEMASLLSIVRHANFALTLTSVDLCGPHGLQGPDTRWDDVPQVITPLLGCTSLSSLRVRGFAVTEDLENLKSAKWPFLDVLVWQNGISPTETGVTMTTLAALSTACPSLSHLDLPLIMPRKDTPLKASSSPGTLENLRRLILSQWLPYSSKHDLQALVDFMDRLGPRRTAKDWISGVVNHHRSLRCRHLRQLWQGVVTELDYRRGMAAPATAVTLLNTEVYNVLSERN